MIIVCLCVVCVTNTFFFMDSLNDDAAKRPTPQALLPLQIVVIVLFGDFLKHCARMSLPVFQI
jgi:hypothetical protein